MILYGLGILADKQRR